MRKYLLFALVAAVIFCGGASLVFAVGTTTPAANQAVVFNPTCIQNAVEKRDTAIIAAWDKFSLAAKTALETRKTALKEAWAKGSAKERRVAVKAAWTAYSKAIRDARNIFKKEKKDAWTQFHKDRVFCKNKEINSLEGGNKEGLDGNL